MANLTTPPLPSTELLLKSLGERLRLARLRRRLQARQVAERAGMSVITLRKIERGDMGVTIGAYAGVLQVLQLQSDLNLIGAEDPLGRRLQDAEGSSGMRIRRVTKNARVEPVDRLVSNEAAQDHAQGVDHANSSRDAASRMISAAISSDDLLGLLRLNASDKSAEKK